MNKYKKIAMAVVSTVMAGSMCFSLAACGGDKKPSNSGGNTTIKPVDPNAPLTGADLYGILKEDKMTINYDTYKNRGKVTLNTAINHDANASAISFRTSDLGNQLKMPDGKTYEEGDVKAAWQQMGDDLYISWNDVSVGASTANNLSGLTGPNADVKYSEVDMFTSDISKIVEAVAGGTSVLNLADYLDYMPNFRNFLENNPIVYLSLLGDGMNTKTGAGKVIYVAPYFDGYDTIERYNIIRKDWAAKILNGSEDLASSTAWGKATSVVSYMGSTNYDVDIVNSDGAGVGKLTKNYSAVASKVKESGHALNTAYLAASNNAAYSGTSGNIVDIMNAAIASNQNVNGNQLAKLFRAYVDVMYDGHYGTNRADLFNGYDAAWDVDELVAMLRCVITNPSLSSTGVLGIVPRRADHDRTPDLTKLAGQLYGVRGTESRYEYTYIDKSGKLQDARNNAEFYQAHANLNTLRQEGLIVDFTSTSSRWDSGVSTASDKSEAFMLYDYSQTQTNNGFYASDPTIDTSKDFDEDYNLAPIINPVSKWDVDGDGNHTDFMRFTESWRSTKTGGLGLNGSLKDNPTKLAAAIQFVDYLYSRDGQITSTFGPMASNAKGDGGFWYNEEATAEQIANNEYFNYKGVKYSGTYYDGRYTPTITQSLFNHFVGKSGNDANGATALSSFTTKSNISGAARNFTSYARRLIGSTLPVGVKDQSFENQLTSECGKGGANIVSTAIAAGVIKHVGLQIDSGNYWYTCVPSGLPVPYDDQKDMGDDTQKALEDLSGRLIANQKGYRDMFAEIVLRGLGVTYNRTVGVELTVVMPDTATALAELISKNTSSGGYGAQIRENCMAAGWDQAKDYWNYLKPKS